MRSYQGVPAAVIFCLAGDAAGVSAVMVTTHLTQVSFYPEWYVGVGLVFAVIALVAGLHPGFGIAGGFVSGLCAYSVLTEPTPYVEAAPIVATLFIAAALTSLATVAVTIEPRRQTPD